MNRRTALVLGVALLCAGVPTEAVEPNLHTREMMSAETFKKAGLEKLTAGELANLDAWLTSYTSAVLNYAKEQHREGTSTVAPQPPASKPSTCERHDHRGCCSHHGGVGTFDPGTCRIVCADGTYSPTCFW